MFVKCWSDYFYTFRKCAYLVTYRVVEVRGVEPLSENLSTKTSPITVCYLTFPPTDVSRHTSALSSFINLFTAQSFAEKVPCLFDAGCLSSRLPKTDGRQIRQLKELRYCLLFFKNLGSLDDYPASMAISDSKSPSKPLHPHLSRYRYHIDIYQTGALLFYYNILFCKVKGFSMTN